MRLCRPVPPHQKRRIPVVDDNIGAMLLTLLRKLGDQEVETVHDRLTALTAIQQMHPDFILLGIGLPGLDGYQVARSIRTML